MRTSPTFSGWFDAHALSLAALPLTSGSLADMYGRRGLWLIGLVVFTGASAPLWRRAVHLDA